MDPWHGSLGSRDAPPGVCLCQDQAERRTCLCAVKGGKLCSKSAVCFCSEVFICVIAGEGSLGGAGKQQGLPSPNNCRRSHGENFPCDVKRCRAQGRARTHVCPRCAPVCPSAMGTPGLERTGGLHGGAQGPGARKHHPEQCGSVGLGWWVPLHRQAPHYTQKVCRAHS